MPILHNEVELKQIPNFPDYYADRGGKVWSKRTKVFRERKGRANTKGYKQITIKDKDGNSWQKQISRLVALTFLPNPNSYPNVLHIDNNPLNCEISNLKWGTQQQNIQQASNEGRLKRKVNNAQCLQIASSPKTRKQLAQEYKISPRMVGRIIKNYKTLTHAIK